MRFLIITTVFAPVFYMTYELFINNAKTITTDLPSFIIFALALFFIIVFYVACLVKDEDDDSVTINLKK